MTKETLQERMTTLSRYFARNKWKAESGFFQYPRGKKRTEAVAEALEIAFDPSEFAIKKELNLRGEDVVGSVFLVAVPTEGIFGGYSYLSLTITDHVFIVTQLPERSVAALALLENSGEKLADSVETYEPEHEEDVSMETDTKEKLEEEVRRITNGNGFDVTIEAVGLPSTFQNCIDCAAYGGRVVLIGVGKKNLDFNFTIIQKKELNIFGSRNALKKDFLELIDLVKAGKVDLEKIVTNTYKLDEADKAFKEFSENAGSMLKVVIDFTK